MPRVTKKWGLRLPRAATLLTLVMVAICGHGAVTNTKCEGPTMKEQTSNRTVHE